jgi:hypothetical protein
MREDDSLGHYVPILRRIVVLVAVIIAVPVILWTITTFVRTYVGPPRLPTFHQLASTASINAPSARTDSEGATSADAAGRSGPILEANASPDPGDSTMPTVSTPDNRSADQQSAVPNGNSATGPLALAEPGASAYDTSESASASQPLSGPIPLPRRRPREAEMRTAEMTPANVPMPRRRPENAGPSTTAETTGSSPIGFIKDLFH